MSMTIGKRIAFGFAASVAVTLGLSAYIWTRLENIDTAIQTLTVDSIPGQFASGQMMDHLREQAFLSLETAASTTPEHRDAVAAKVKAADTHLAQVFKDYAATIKVEANRANFDELNRLYATWFAARDKVLNAPLTGQKAVDAFNAEALPAFEAAVAQIDKVIDWNASSAAVQAESATASAQSAHVGLYFGGTAAFAVASILGFFIVRGTRKSLVHLSETLSNGSSQVASASAQVSSSSQSLAQGASEQAASLEESSSALEEMSSMIKKNADTSAQASIYSEEAKCSSDRGTEAMAKMSEAIVEIERGSQETAKIIKVIDEIAFQTNLLALNAAVEAARAGEAGKGFAVVAEEVRNLAMRSAEAAKNTSLLIAESVGKAKNGVSIAQSVATNLQQINESTTKVTGLIAEIAAASREQATGIDQITQAVSQMDKVTQSNAASAEETAAASEELSAQAEQLRGCVGELQKIVGTGSSSQVASSRPSASFERSVSLVRPTPVASKKSARTYAASTGNKSTGFASAKPRSPKPSAKELIPLEENLPSGDFSEFTGTKVA